MSVAEAVLGTVGVGRWEVRGRGPDSDGADQIPPPPTFLLRASPPSSLGSWEMNSPVQISLGQWLLSLRAFLSRPGIMAQ